MGSIRQYQCILVTWRGSPDAQGSDLIVEMVLLWAPSKTGPSIESEKDRNDIIIGSVRCHLVTCQWPWGVVRMGSIVQQSMII